MRALTSSPGLSRGLVTSFFAHGIWLTLILRNTGVDGLNDIRSNGRSEDLFNRSQLKFPMTFPASSSIFPHNRKFITKNFEVVVPLGEDEWHRWQCHQRKEW
jgi:hypothetical protein